jgi:superkiller protein 3
MNRKTLHRTLDTALEYHHSGRLEEAARLYAQVCRSAPQLFDAWYLAGTLAVHRDRPEEAVPLLTRAIRLSPGSTKCKLFLGMALADLGRFAEAERPLRDALAKHPDYPDAWDNLNKTMQALAESDETASLRKLLSEFMTTQSEVLAPVPSQPELASMRA